MNVRANGSLDIFLDLYDEEFNINLLKLLLMFHGLCFLKCLNTKKCPTSQPRIFLKSHCGCLKSSTISGKGQFIYFHILTSLAEILTPGLFHRVLSKLFLLTTGTSAGQRLVTKSLSVIGSRPREMALSSSFSRMRKSFIPLHLFLKVMDQVTYAQELAQIDLHSCVCTGTKM